ncbi:MAG: hypothetical protein MJZ40_00750 [Bacteroidaceae bacterium]|nr:hypothetical protein [Bacteroidaceae bacterium]
MRNAGIALLTLLIGVFALFAACDDDEIVQVEGEGVLYTSAQAVDSLSFCLTHHYWKGQRFVTTDSVALITSVPSEAWQPDTLMVSRSELLVVADIVALPGQTPDSIWLKMVVPNDTLPVQGWANEADILRHSRPTHLLARTLAFIPALGLCESLMDVPDGDYSDAWLEFYLHPTANPWLLPLPMALVVIVAWGLLILLLGGIDRLIFDRYRYRCGHCNAPLRHLGRCPHCGIINEA